MKYFIYILICSVLLNSCSLDNDNETNCALLDPLVENFLVELVDADGNNLIENGTFNADDITVTVNSQNVGSVLATNIIAISENGGDLRNDSDYVITLSDTEQDILRLTLTAREIECGFVIYTATFASYNGVEQEIQENLSGGGQSIRVVR